MQQNLNEDGITNAIPLSEKYMLTIREAACYFNIGVKKIGSMSVRVIKVTPCFRMKCTVSNCGCVYCCDCRFGVR